MILQSILVPLDGSVTAEAVLPHVRRLLRRSDSEVILLRVANPPAGDDYMPLYEASLAAAREYVTGIRDRLLGQGTRASAVARVGPPAGTILEVAEEKKATMIALATHGRTGVARAILGSVAEHVIRRSAVPVIAVRPFWTYEIAPGRPEDQPIRTILVPVDGSELSLGVVPAVGELAGLFGARVLLLRVLESGAAAKARAPGGATGETFAEKDLAEVRLKEVAERLRGQGVEAGTIVGEGDPAAAIQQSVRFHGVDLVAMTTHGRSGISRMVVGSVTEKVLREAKVPMLVVRAMNPAPEKVAVEGEEKR
jgi:nucleotide-binding universal stress UspA family protein